MTSIKEDNDLMQQMKDSLVSKGMNEDSIQRGRWFTREAIRRAFSDVAFSSRFKRYIITAPTEWSESQWCEDIEKLLVERDNIPPADIENKKNELYSKSYWYDDVKNTVNTLPAANETVSFHPVHFIEFARDFLPNKNKMIIDYFKQRVKERDGNDDMWKADGVNIISIRHLGQEEGERAATGKRHANDLWILVIDEEVRGFFLANTEPGVTVYQDSVARGGIGCLIPGSYKYRPKISTKKVRDDYIAIDNKTRIPGLFNPDGAVPVWRDANGNGNFDLVEQVPAEKPGIGFQLHWMGAIANNVINSYSAGCQGLKGNYYIDAKGELRYFLDSEYNILAELHTYGIWALFMKMVDKKVFTWASGKEDIDGELIEKFVYYHLFDEDRDNINKKIIDRAQYVDKMIVAN